VLPDRDGEEMGTVTISYDEVAALTAELVAIDSTNPDLVPGGAGEAEIARFVAGWLESVGLDVELRELGPRRANVIAVARGSGGGRSLMLNAHMDVVGAGGMNEPWTPRIDGTRLYGRGAYDMKASLAAIMLAGREAAKLNLRGDVIHRGRRRRVRVDWRTGRRPPDDRRCRDRRRTDRARSLRSA